MEKVMLMELGMTTREEVLAFLKRLWDREKTACPICGSELELLHKKAKKSVCTWQCKMCHKIYKTIHLLDELNEMMPN